MAPRAAIEPNLVLMQFRELFRASQQHFQRIEARCGISGAQLWALAELAQSPGLSVSDLARVLCVRLPTASNIVRKLEDRGLVQRQRGAGDQRVVNVVITRSGLRLLDRAPKPVQGVIQEALAHMPSPALGRLHRDLALLLDRTSGRNRNQALRHLSEN